MKKWYHNAYTGEIESCHVSDKMTDFPRGVLLVYDDYLTIGFDSKQEAIEWAKKWGRCDKCKGSAALNKDTGKCFRCGSEVKFMPVIVEE